ncbi:hypothetical protein BTN49_2336 [Candidatus Enterovibrio escicola]|uniref:Uncharacterized protein n=1 Tax=Candidatus Enterovibrio escicola TaxID=1927127 RepID=A0A2A5T1Q3_9GAMM|nr:hypothetical protein BTN49_2336 [Candidatus Enterovibrio escacola]
MVTCSYVIGSIITEALTCCIFRRNGLSNVGKTSLSPTETRLTAAEIT